MFRYLTINSWTASFLAGTVVALMVLQTITPTIVYGMEESTESAQEQTTEEPTPPEPVVITQEAGVVTEEETEETETPSEPTETIVETEDAEAGTNIENEVNTTEIDTKEDSNPATEDDETVDGSDPLAEDDEELPDPTTSTVTPAEEVSGHAHEDPSLLSVQATNTAAVENNATTSATTGENSASGETVTVDTGDAVAYVDVLNVVNTNIVNSDGLVEFINGSLGYQDFDLRDEFELTYTEFDTAESTPSCNLDACSDNVDTTINIDNTADIENNITVIADTGNNQASGDSATINTGDAYASANVINVANTNITDSNYLLLVFNNFDSYAGDIVLPNSSFFDRVLQNSGGVSNVDLDINNTATINNSVETVANTGDNTASGGDSSITTGNAVATSDTLNQVNQNIIGGSSFSMLIRVHGDWSGSINGLPEGLTWHETDQGIEIVSTDRAGGNGSPVRNLVQSTDNTATINNNVKVFALTGDNEAAGDEASIDTGDAYADSSVLNIANTNVIGSNWSNLIFTIYGNWSGNLTFGQPNLWLGVTADSPNSPIMPRSEVTYTYTVFNRGDVTAPNVTLDSMFETGVMAFADTGNQTSLGANTKNSWSLGDIEPGETREFTRTAKIDRTLDHDSISALPLTSRVESTQKDADTSDNEEVVTIYVGEHRPESSSRKKTFPAHFDITKTASRDLAQPGDIVDYTVTFFNRGGQLFDGMLVDVLENEAGEIIQQQSWPFEEIKNWETITVSYSVEFDSAMETGNYTNYAQLVGFHESKKEKYQTPYESPVVSHTLGLGTVPAGQVLGMTTSQCPAYLTEYLRFGHDNNPEEVRKLQQFLNEQLARNLSLSGFFNLETEQAVRDFQIIHKDEILTPWGIENDSGYVYYTTQKKINEIVCGGLAAFPLAPSQQQEIVSFKTKLQKISQSSFQAETPPVRPTIPENITPAVTQTPTVRQQEKNQVFETIDNPPSSPEPFIAPTPQNRWNGVRTWWHSVSQGLRATLSK